VAFLSRHGYKIRASSIFSYLILNVQKKYKVKNAGYVIFKCLYNVHKPLFQKNIRMGRNFKLIPFLIFPNKYDGRIFRKSMRDLLSIAKAMPFSSGPIENRLFLALEDAYYYRGKVLELLKLYRKEVLLK
jgi:hypothetical protein